MTLRLAIVMLAATWFVATLAALLLFTAWDFDWTGLALVALLPVWAVVFWWVRGAKA